MNTLASDESDLAVDSGGDGEPAEVLENRCYMILFYNEQGPNEQAVAVVEPRGGKVYAIPDRF